MANPEGAPPASIVQRLEPEARKLLDMLAREDLTPLQEMSVTEARQYMRAGQATPIEHPSITVQRSSYAGVPLTILRPASAAGSLPAVLYLHGGGWVLGGADTHARLTRELALRASAAIIVPDYPLAPEHRYPVALDQIYAIAQALAANDVADNIDGSRLAVAGDSAGGNLAAAVALLAARHGGPELRLQLLLCPALQAEASTDSYREFADGFNLTAGNMRWFLDQYVPDRNLWHDPLVSPLKAASEDLLRVAPAWIATAECDALRDEAEQFAQRLWSLGKHATCTRYLGTIHNFMVNDALAESGPALAATAAAGEALRFALHATEGVSAWR